jgi:serine/threonine-protein kinase
VWCFRDYIVLAMELARGSLLDVLTDSGAEFGRHVTAQQIWRYLSQAADALDFLNTPKHRLYGQRVALRHGNVKPSNLLLVGDTVKLTDFKLSS